MTADLPTISKPSQHFRDFPEVKPQTAPTFVENHDESGGFLDHGGHAKHEAHAGSMKQARLPILRNGLNAGQRNEKFHLYRVKFGTNADPNTIEKHRTELSAPDTTLNVGHDHYEQWARVPTKRTTNSVLLRGIQQLKAKLKREGVEEREEREVLIPGRVSMIVREKTIDDSTPQGFPLRRERTNPNLSADVLANRSSYANTRGLLKTNQQVIDSELFDHEMKVRSEKNEKAEKERQTDSRTDAPSPRDMAKPRLGIARIRDRCPLPVTVNQPMCLGDHVFLVNDPSRNVDFPRSRTRINDPHSAVSKSASEINSFPVKGILSDARLVTPGVENSEAFQRSKSFFGSFPPKKNNLKRTPAFVSSAEVFDFSQLVEIRRSNELKLLERTKTESAFPVRNSRPSSKWVAKAYRIKEQIH